MVNVTTANIDVWYQEVCFHELQVFFNAFRQMEFLWHMLLDLWLGKCCCYI